MRLHVTLERILYVGTDGDYRTAIETETDGTVTVRSRETAESVDVADGQAGDAVVVDTAGVEEPVGTVRSLADRTETTPVVAVVESTTDPVLVFDVLSAGADDYVERDAPSGRPRQLVARLEATLSAAESVAADDVAKLFQRELDARRRTEQRLRTVLDRIPHPVFYRDSEGVYLGCNAAFETLCGQDREDIIGHRTDTLQNEQLAEVCARHDEKVRRTGENQVIETTVTVDGEQRHVRVQKAPLSDEEAGIEGIVGSVEDVTEQRRQKQKLETQTENLEILNSVTRHDIRNDLQVVLGMAEVLRDHVDEQGLEYLDTMVTKGHHAVDITRQARDLTETMLESEFGTERIPLKSTLETQLDEIRSTYSRAIVTVEGEIPSVSVLADGMLASVFRNILANGIQHNDSSVPRLRVWVQTTEERVTVHIADNGPGIPDERKDEIFGRGEKGLESSGTGLGLYLVDTLLDRYDGDVYVTDGEDGSEFVITLQRA
ncbi:ATP-binding protein [Haloarcula rara]|uniref:ATP-binding protein n=2 Tax=Haloarcula TaxID=2237 RepID=UPI0023E7D228|nr:PAS domain-containing sensor histidine kinase [Halomicroarcula sp. SHR3]